MLKWHYWAGIIISVILGISTLVPASASKPCLLGYYAHCSFTPVSTVICFIIAVAIYQLGKREEKQSAEREELEREKLKKVTMLEVKREFLPKPPSECSHPRKKIVSTFADMRDLGRGVLYECPDCGKRWRE